MILTHGHADHIGGNLDAEARPAFPNARYVMAQAEWEFWTGAPNLGPMPVAEPLKHLLIATAQRNLPLRPQIDLLDGESEIVPGIRPFPPPAILPGTSRSSSLPATSSYSIWPTRSSIRSSWSARIGIRASISWPIKR